MDVISTKVDLVIEPMDGFTGERQLQGAVFAKINDHAEPYALKKDNCFVFFNKPPGKYKITVGGNCYQPAELDVEFDGSVKNITVVLMPSRSYKFSQTAVKIYGRSSKTAKLRFVYGSDRARILGEYAAGEKMINAFLPENDPVKNYFLGEKPYFLRRLGGTEYELDRPLEDDIDSASAVGLCREIPSGEYFIAVRGSFKTAEIFSENTKKTIELSGENTEYDL